MCEQTKKCVVCYQIKPLDEYPKRSGPKPSKDLEKQYRHECRKCYNDLQILGRKRRAAEDYVKPTLENLPPREPRCGHCGELKTWEDFNKSSGTRSGYHGWCKTCIQEDRVRLEPHLKQWRFDRATKQTLKYLLIAAKTRSKQKGEVFSVTEEELTIPDKCPILGVPMVFNTPYCPSLDRIDNSKGYISGNVWVISRKANTMKNDADLRAWKTFCENSLKFIEENTLV